MLNVLSRKYLSREYASKSTHESEGNNAVGLSTFILDHAGQCRLSKPGIA